jgi:uncharacterized membrane protein YgdD (TMEM256/DUF423 family)
LINAPRALGAIAAFVGFLAVVAGAYADHGLHDANAQRLMHTGAEYGLIHALAVFAALSVAARSPRLGLASAWLFLAGQVLFSLSLYLMALTGNHVFGLVTPFGGLAMMAGWLALALAALRQAHA